MFRISVITVVRNGALILEETILSIIKQKKCSIELIIIDGYSTDNTINVIQKYKEYISYWVSEKDKGIYDAMNKGILAARGEWIIFMNAGDKFFDSETCASIDSNIINSDQIIYGDFQARNVKKGQNTLIKARPLKKILEGMVFCHQSVLVKAEILKSHLFNLDFVIVSDYDQMLTLYKEGYNFRYIPITVSEVSIGGLSYSNKSTILETIKVIHKFQPYSPHILKKMPYLVLNGLKSFIGEKNTDLIRSLKWRLKRS